MSKKISLQKLKSKKFIKLRNALLIYIGEKKLLKNDRDKYDSFYYIKKTKGKTETIGIGILASGQKIKKLSIFNIFTGKAIVMYPKKLDITDMLKILIAADKLKKTHRFLFESEGSSDNKSNNNQSAEKAKSVADKVAEKLGNFGPGSYAIMTVLSLLVLLFVYGKMLKMKFDELYASWIQKKIQKEIFKGQSKNVPPLQEYAELVESIKTLINSKNVNGLLVYGPPGTGKSYMVQRTLYFEGAPAVYYKGATMSLEDFAYILYKHKKGKIIVFDDFDTGFRNEDFVNILKAAMDSYPKRIITVPKALDLQASGNSAALGIGSLPERFVFESKIIIITNRSKNQINKALLSRALPVYVDFDAKTLVKIIEKVLKFLVPDIDMKTKLDILDKVKQLQEKCKFRLDFRVVSSALDIYRALGEKWEQIFRQIYCGGH